MKTRLLLISLCLLGATLVVRQAWAPEAVPARASLSHFPVTAGAWRMESAVPLEPQILRVLGVNDYLNRVYRAPDGHFAGLYVGYYASQRQGDTIHSPLNCLPGAGWEPVTRDRIVLTVPVTPAPGAASRAIRVNRILVQKGLDQAVVLYWYQSHGRVVASEYWGRAYMALDALRLHRTDGALVRIIAFVEGNDAGAEASANHEAESLARAITPELGPYLPS
ncbi:MAG TPA: EpsI family protein [Vicinamibacterales bacterium]|nr:EpsI family protein [Vicinamibacterales bacterium]